MTTIFGSVVYPAAIPFIPAFLQCLNQQSNHSFLLLLINDGIPSYYLDAIMCRYNYEYELIGYSEQLTPQKLRVQLLLEAQKRNCKYFIFGDVDDIFSCDRVEQIVSFFRENSNVGFVYNDLLSFSNQRIMPDLPERTDSINRILEYNYLGLSNTAIRLEVIDDAFIESLDNCSTIAFDWYLFSRLILIGQVGHHIAKSATFYRLHENNSVGIPDFSKAMIDKERSLKEDHYRSLLGFGKPFREYWLAYKNERYELNRQDAYYWWNLTRKVFGDEI